MSLEQSDKEAAAVATAPRVTLDMIKDNIAAQYGFTAAQAIEGMNAVNTMQAPVSDALKLLSICILVTRSGFVLIGTSAPASPANYNAELGQKFAYEDAVRQLWPLMGYALREKLAGR